MKREEMLIEVGELLTNLDKPALRLFDATVLFFRQDSEATAYEQYMAGHIPGAAFFDHDAFSDASNSYMYMLPTEEKLAAQIGKIGISEDSEVVFYTHDLLPTATRAWWVLRYAGHNNVRVLNGGLAAWKQAGGMVEQGTNSYAPATFNSELRPQMIASKEDVLAAMGNGAVCTVNTLNPESYNNGHIQGSSLLPCSDLMHGMAAFISTEEIATKLQEEAEHERIITYCGGGFAATVNAMAHLMAGNENVAVYDGSMDEWAGEKLPITAKTAVN
ncbi:sulfurtransferase [Candidatus Leptofilum sp.]|uniref:sulfurtransferase n=1 Tax=Candidatus Leptofilum sp. TaxID=3241576 RepID=UPI003B5C3DA9